MTFTPDFISRFWSAVAKRSDNECWLWQKAINAAGYGVIRFNGVLLRANRVAFLLSGGVLPQGYGALHRCDVRHCCNPAHLFSGTHMDNQHDCISKGRAIKAFGERVATAKMTDAKVYQAREMYAGGGWTHLKLAQHFGLSKSAMGYLLNGQHWSHVSSHKAASKLEERTEIELIQL